VLKHASIVKVLEEWKEMTKGVRYAAEIKISFILAQKDL